MSIKLHCFKKDADVPSLSGYCEKVETLLRATGFTDYALVPTLPFSAPKGKLPYIEYIKDGKTETIADSHFIVRYLTENKIVADLDKNLTPAQRADSRAWQSWFEDLVYGAVAHERFFKPENFAVTKAALPLPWWIRPIIAWYLRRGILGALWSSGIGRHSVEDRHLLAREFFEGLEARLEGVEFFHGSEPTLIDVTLFAFLSGTITGQGNPETTALILKSKRLRQYIAVMVQKWYPEYKGLLAQLDKKHAD